MSDDEPCQDVEIEDQGGIPGPDVNPNAIRPISDEELAELEAKEDEAKAKNDADEATAKAQAAAEAEHQKVVKISRESLAQVAISIATISRALCKQGVELADISDNIIKAAREGLEPPTT